MGIGGHFNCCGKGNVQNTSVIMDNNEQNNENENKNNGEENNIIAGSNINFNRDYTFKGKSINCTNSTLVMAKNDSNINKGPFVPNTIEQKNTKEAMESFDEMFNKLN